MGYGHGHHHDNVIEDLSLTMFKNEIFVLVGPNGAGKSSLAEVMAGL